jgi:hypothetical protein
MKKNYASPEVSKIKVDSFIKPTMKVIEIDADILRMLSRKGFIKLFWEKLSEARKFNAAITHKEIFDLLNEKWLNFSGEMKYSSYDSFRQRIND